MMQTKKMKMTQTMMRYFNCQNLLLVHLMLYFDELIFLWDINTGCYPWNTRWFTFHQTFAIWNLSYMIISDPGSGRKTDTSDKVV